MPKTVKVDVHHITRVEGHGNIKVDVQNGELKECKLEIVEAPRFFEAMLKGRHYDEAALITSRICGICSVGHQMASISATEDAFGIKISEQERLLRNLLNCGEYFESHVLHVYFLAVPDFAGAKSVLPLVATHKDIVVQALKLKKLGHEIGDMIGGRLIHSMASNVKAMTKVPTDEILNNIIDRLKDAKEELKVGLQFLKTLKLPDFEGVRNELQNYVDSLRGYKADDYELEQEERDLVYTNLKKTIDLWNYDVKIKKSTS